MRLNPLIAGLLLLSLGSPALAEDSAMFRGDLEHSGVYASASVMHSPKVKWKFHTNGYVNSTPAVANGTVYVGSADGSLYAIAQNTGKLRWR